MGNLQKYSHLSFLMVSLKYFWYNRPDLLKKLQIYNHTYFTQDNENGHKNIIVNFDLV